MAALLVVVSHLDRMGFDDPPRFMIGASGVMVFFTLSGFLMGHLYLSKPFDLAAVTHFVAARVSRILPLFVAVVLLSYALSKIIGPGFVFYFSEKDVLKHLALLGSKPVFWSIPPEVEFYGLFLVLWGLVARRRLARYGLVLTAALGVIMVARPLFPGITVFAEIHIFLVGVLASVVYGRVSTRVQPGAAMLVQIVALLALASLLARFPSHGFFLSTGWQSDATVYGDLQLTLLFGVALFAFTIPTALTTAMLANRFMASVGRYSFSIYLLHLPVMLGLRLLGAQIGLPVAGQVILAFAGMYAVSALSFRSFEQPMQRVTRRLVVGLFRRFTPASVLEGSPRPEPLSDIAAWDEGAPADALSSQTDAAAAFASGYRAR